MTLPRERLSYSSPMVGQTFLRSRRTWIRAGQRRGSYIQAAAVTDSRWAKMVFLSTAAIAVTSSRLSGAYGG
jgi:hypothetical protein